MIISHRGYAKEHPENTFAAFDAAFSAGADAIETDVRIAGDGTLVVSHDPVKSSRGIITLDELFEYIASNKLIDSRKPCQSRRQQDTVAFFC